MAQYQLGQVAIISKGAWATGTSYASLNTVSHNGGSFMAIAQNASVEPGVASNWQNYWVSMSRGIKTIDVQAVTTSSARAIITLSDGSTVTGSTFNTTALAANAVATANVQNGAITAAKLGSDILPTNVGIKMGTSVPTTADISAGQVYLQYEA